MSPRLPIDWDAAFYGDLPEDPGTTGYLPNCGVSGGARILGQVSQKGSIPINRKPRRHLFRRHRYWCNLMFDQAPRQSKSPSPSLHMLSARSPPICYLFRRDFMQGGADHGLGPSRRHEGFGCPERWAFQAVIRSFVFPSVLTSRFVLEVLVYGRFPSVGE